MKMTDLWMTCINCLMHTNNDTIILYTVKNQYYPLITKMLQKCIEQICNEQICNDMGYTACETVNGPIKNIIKKLHFYLNMLI